MQGKVGDDLVVASQRHDHDRAQSDLRWDTLSRHGTFAAARTHDCASMYQMVNGLRGEDAQRVQRYLWQGRKRNDLAVPVHVDTLRSTLPPPTSTMSSMAALGSSPARFGLTSFNSGGTGIGSLHGSMRSCSAAPLRPTPINHITATTVSTFTFMP